MQNEATAKLPYIRHWHEKRSIKAKEKFIGFYYFVVQKKYLHRAQQNVKFKGGSVIWPYL